MISATSSVVKPNGKHLAAVKQALSGSGKVVVGFVMGGASHEGTPMATVAAAHEFGTKNIPERPFLRVGLREGLDAQRAMGRRSAIKIAHGTLTLDQALRQLGLLGQMQVQAKIANGSFAPLAESTIKAKGSSRPLIDTGDMRKSVTFEVRGDK